MEYSTVSVWELRKRVSELGLPTSGNRNALILQLQTADALNVNKLKEEIASLKKVVELLSGDKQQLQDLIKKASLPIVEASVDHQQTMVSNKRQNKSKTPLQDSKIESREDSIDGNEGFTVVTSRRRQRASKARQVLLLGDSNARGLAGLMQKQLGNSYQVQSVVKPGGPLPFVLSESKAFTRHFPKKDLVVVIGGTNGLEKLPAQIGTVAKDLKELSHTRVMMTDILKRHDTNKFEALRLRVNDRMKGNFSALAHCTFVDPNRLLTRQLYTRHGLHLSEKGKEGFSKTLSSAILRKDFSKAMSR